MDNKDWDVKAEGDECVHITINDGVTIDGLELVLLSDTRTPIVKMKINARDINICTHTDRPMFAQIGHSVKYVTGSGDEYYDEVVKHN